MARTRYKSLGTTPPLSSLPAAALRAVLREGYGRADLKADILAGLVVGVVAVPLAMALGVAVGVPPQLGLYTAIIAGVVVALLGGSRTQVSGPTAAFVVVLAPLHAEHGLGGLLFAGLIAGVILVLMGIFRLGALIQYVPHPVTAGFTAGIATVIAVMQLRDLLGLRMAASPTHFLERLVAMVEALDTVSLPEVGTGLATLGLLLGLPRILRRVPAPLVALPAISLAALGLGRFVPGFEVETIATRFQFVVDGVTTSGIPRLPPTPLWPWAPGGGSAEIPLDPATLRSLLASGLTIAMLGAIESLLSAVVADGMARTRHDPDAELIALGVGNVVAPFFGGIAATGAIARTATNVRAGARSPIAAMVHALTVLLAVLALAPLLGYVPMSALAALLLIVAWNMSDVKHVVHILRVAPRSDVLVLAACYGLTVAVDMVVGVAVGMVLAALLFMRRMAEVTEARVTEQRHSAAPRELPPGVVLYEISGPLFFGAAQKAMAALHVIGARNRAVVLLMNGVSVMDATGLVALESALDELRRQKCLALLCGVLEQPRRLLEKAHVGHRPMVVLCDDVSEALERARIELAVSPAVAGEV